MLATPTVFGVSAYICTRENLTCVTLIYEIILLGSFPYILYMFYYDDKRSERLIKRFFTHVIFICMCASGEREIFYCFVIL